jgi:hypothetical protein
VGLSIKWDVKRETIPGEIEAAKLLTKNINSPGYCPRLEIRFERPGY